MHLKFITVLYSRMKENLGLRFRFVASIDFWTKIPQSGGFALVEYRVPCISRTFYLRGSLCKDLSILYYTHRFILKMSVLNFWHDTKTALLCFAYRYNCLTLARLDFWKIRYVITRVARTCKLVSFVFQYAIEQFYYNKPIKLNQKPKIPYAFPI